MADQSDVENALAGAVASLVYPAGPTGPSILDHVVRVYRGWPNAAALDADLAAGVVNVTVFPAHGHEQVTTRFSDEPILLAPIEPTFDVTVAGATATIVGSPAPNQIVGLLADQTAVAYRTTATDTADRIAASLAAQLAPTRVALAVGPTVTIPGVGSLIARIVADQPARSELRRQRQAFRITCWCPDPAARDAAAAAIDAGLAAQRFLPLPDGTAARLRYVSSVVLDQGQDAALCRRDLVYDAEYATTITIWLPSMLFGEATCAPNGGPIVTDELA